MEQKFVLEKDLNEAKIKEWCTQFGEFNKLRRPDKDHIVNQLCTIVKWYDGKRSLSDLGHFLKAVIQNDFINATCRADLANYRCLCVYAKFLYNMIPMDYVEKLHISEAVQKMFTEK